MSSPAPRSATWDDLLDVRDDHMGEIVGGELRVHPRPGAPHAETTSDLGALLVPPFRFGRGGPGGWVIVDEPRIAFADDIRVPDLAGWRTERYRRPLAGPYEVVPDWVCEVLSPGTAVMDRTEKLPLYARCSVHGLWLIDPVACTLEAYRREQEGYLSIVPPMAPVGSGFLPSTRSSSSSSCSGVIASIRTSLASARSRVARSLG